MSAYISHFGVFHVAYESDEEAVVVAARLMEEKARSRRFFKAFASGDGLTIYTSGGVRSIIDRLEVGVDEIVPGFYLRLSRPWMKVLLLSRLKDDSTRPEGIAVGEGEDGRILVTHRPWRAAEARNWAIGHVGTDLALVVQVEERI